MKKTMFVLTAILAVLGLFFASCPADTDGKVNPGKDNYKVTFDLNYEGAPNLDPYWCPKGEFTMENNFPDTPFRPGYAFDGWFGTENEDELFTEYTTVTGNMTVKARWTRLWTLTFESNVTGANPINPINNIRDGSPVTLPAVPPNGDLNFVGWYDAEGKRYNNSTAITLDVLLTARWIDGYVIEFINTWEPVENVAVVKGTSMGDEFPPDPAVPETAEGLTFAGWYLGDYADNLYASTNPKIPIALGDVKYDRNTPITGDITLVAKYRGDGIEHIVSTMSNSAVYVFDIPAARKLGDYTKVTVEILGTAPVNGRLRFWATYSEDHWDYDKWENMPDVTLTARPPRGIFFGNNNAGSFATADATPPIPLTEANNLNNTRLGTINQAHNPASPPWQWQKWEMKFFDGVDARFQRKHDLYGDLWDDNMTGKVIFAIGVIGQGGESWATAPAPVRAYYITKIQLENDDGTFVLPCRPFAEFMDGDAFVGNDWRGRQSTEWEVARDFPDWPIKRER